MLILKKFGYFSDGIKEQVLELIGRRAQKKLMIFVEYSQNLGPIGTHQRIYILKFF